MLSNKLEKSIENLPAVDAAAGRCNDQPTKIEIQINELDNSFQDCNIDAVSIRSTNR